MMWRAFIPAWSKHDTDALPAWFVSFDGQAFIEIKQKPAPDNANLLGIAWRAAMSAHGQSLVTFRRKRHVTVLEPIFLRSELAGLAQIEEVVC